MLSWFVDNRPGDMIFPNNTGFASREKVRYGIPTSGGGFDNLIVTTEGRAEWMEVKTDAYKNLSADQKKFARNMTKQGCRCWVYREGRCAPVIWDQYQP